MNIIQVAFALVLLTSPPDSVELRDPKSAFMFVAPTLHALALQMELMDPKEPDRFTNQQDFVSELKLLQERYVELANAPKAEEVSRFPSWDLANELMKFNRDYLQSVNDMLALDTLHAEQWSMIVAETEKLYFVYDAIRDARTAYQYVYARRQALVRLRDMIGAAAFCTGQLPPHVPLWRIPEAQ